MKKYLTPGEIKKLSLQEMLDKTSESAVPKETFTAKNTLSIHNLFYSWHGILSEMAKFPKETQKIIELCVPLWEKDGFELLHFTAKSKTLQILCKVDAEISPEKFTQKIKGRLDYAFRQASINVKFSRALGFRSLGFNISKIVQNYINGQVDKEELADNKYRDILKQFTTADAAVQFTDPHKNKRGLYWYNIHLVIVIADRTIRITKDETFAKIKKLIPAVAKKHKYKIADFSIMPDHIHIAMQGNPKESPYDIGLSFMNNLAYMMKMDFFWRREFYVGTFSEYSLSSLGINQNITPSNQNITPTRQARG